MPIVIPYAAEPRSTRIVQADTPHSGATSRQFVHDTNATSFRGPGTRASFCYPELKLDSAAWRTNADNVPRMSMTVPGTTYDFEWQSIGTTTAMEIPWVATEGHHWIIADIHILTEGKHVPLYLRLKQEDGFDSGMTPATGNWSSALEPSSIAIPTSHRRYRHLKGGTLARFKCGMSTEERGENQNGMSFKVQGYIDQVAGTFMPSERYRCYIMQMGLFEIPRASRI